MRFEEFQTKFRRPLEENFGAENVLPFWGNKNARIVHIGQAPSRQGVKNRKPFSDATGRKLREWYGVSEEIFYDPDNFYFTAVGMYFPGKNKGGGDKQPSMAFAKKWLVQELNFLTPKLYIVLGGMAAKFFFPKSQFSELVFENQEIKGKPVIILPHASPLNIKWFKDHPKFYEFRLREIRGVISSWLQRGR